MAEEEKKDENTKEQKSGNGSDKQGEEITIYEVIIAVLGAVFVFSSIIFMTYKAITANDRPPDLVVTKKKVEKVQAGYLLEFEVKNNGEYAGAAAVIKGELKEGEQTKETSTTTVDYVPSYSTRSGGIFFKNDPDKYTLDLQATGYSEP